jgi:hypothetical protein
MAPRRLRQAGRGRRMNNIGVPTMFNGTRYRSRLEARWAAFFDLLKWDAHYEPFDLNGYIPDFVINGRDAWSGKKEEQIFVEVKPVMGMADLLFERTATKMRAAVPDKECLIVSYFLPCALLGMRGPGWLFEMQMEEFYGELMNTGQSWEAAVFTTNRETEQIGFAHSVGSYVDRITGFYDGDQGLGAVNVACLWREAGNLVQWRKPAL